MTISIILIVGVNVIAAQKYESMIVVGDNVNVRTVPDGKAPIIVKLYNTNTVLLLKISQKAEVIMGFPGKWVYVDTQVYPQDNLNDTIKGWVFDYYLARDNQFQKIQSIKKCSVEAMIGDSVMSYKVNSDGSYVHKVYADESNAPSLIKGHLLRYRDTVIAQDENGRREFFYFSSNGILCSQFHDGDGKQIMFKFDE